LESQALSRPRVQLFGQCVATCLNECARRTIEPVQQSRLGLGSSTKRTRRREHLDEMDQVVQWSGLVAEIAPFMPDGKRGRPPFSVASLQRIHFMQQWFTLSDLAMEEALHDTPG